MTQSKVGVEIAVTRRKGRPKLDEAADIDRAIHSAALEVLMEHGEAATLNSVAKAAGISRKSLYARYSNKSALFIEVIRLAMHEPNPIAFANDGPVEQDLFAYIRTMLDVVASDRSVTIQRLLAVDPAYIHALKAEIRASSDRHFLCPLQDLLVQAVARDEVAPCDTGAIARVVVHLIFAESHSRQTEQPKATPTNWRENYARFLADLLCSGLLPRPAN